MIQEINSFEKYIDFIDDIASDPCYSDPHYTYDKSNLFNAIQSKNQKPFVTLKGETVTGIFAWIISPEDQNIEMLTGLSRDRDAYSEMITYIEKQYQNYQLDFVFNPQNMILIDLLKNKNAQIDIEQLKMRWVNDVKYTTDYQIQLFSSEYETQYLSLHHKDMFWTGEKVLEAKDRFRVVLAIKDHQVIGYLDTTYRRKENEIYDLNVKKKYANKGYETALVAEAIRLNKPNGMMVVLDVDSEEIKYFETLGFEKLKGQNSLYATYRA